MRHETLTTETAEFAPAECAEIARWEHVAGRFGWMVTRITRHRWRTEEAAFHRDNGGKFLALLHPGYPETGAEAVFIVRQQHSAWFVTSQCQPASEAAALRSLRDALELVFPTMPQPSDAVH
jgi:hypothetical protein